jgi:hypothetical protein
VKLPLDVRLAMAHDDQVVAGSSEFSPQCGEFWLAIRMRMPERGSPLGPRSSCTSA